MAPVPIPANFPDPSRSEAEALALLHRFYGYDSFRPMQMDVIRSITSGRDTVVLMPTGGGKSVCYQIPALMARTGVTIVVSPLIALMRDQVEGLIGNGIPAAAINSLQSDADNRRVMDLAYSGRLKLLYISPERLMLELDRLAVDFPVAMIAVDEAHCISQWGHDFRPEYTQLGALKERFARVPVMALTATADRATRDDIVRQLRLDSPDVYISSFDRPNISLTVMSGLKKAAKLRHIKALADRYPGDAGIVYCLSRKSTEQLAEDLRALGYAAAPYHAMLSPAVRTSTQQRFVAGDLQIVCATVAFGMGIDKSNIRWVAHYNMPLSLESYYQEIGRAGRDGLPAQALLFFSASDLITLQHFVDESGRQAINTAKLRRMRDYVDARVCRRRVLLSYFNEATDHDCGNCDVCLNPPERFDGTRLAQMALSAVARTDGRAGVSMLVDLLRGSVRHDLMERGYQHLKTYGVGRDVPYRDWTNYITQMLQLGLIDVDYSAQGRFAITEQGRKVLFGGETVMLARPDAAPVSARAAKEPKPVSATEVLMGLLKKLRLELAKKQGVPPYVVFSDRTLTDMVNRRPHTREEFEQVSGVGQVKAERYWFDFVNCIRRHYGLQPIERSDSLDRITAMLARNVAPVEIARQIGISEKKLYADIAAAIDRDAFGQGGLLVSREQFADIIKLNTSFPEAEFRRLCRERYPAGLEDVAIAIAMQMLRKRQQGVTGS